MVEEKNLSSPGAEDRIPPSPGPLPPARQDLRRLLPGLAISLASLAIVLYLAKPQRLIAALRQANFVLVLLAGSISLAWLFVRAIVWRTLLQEKATLSQTFFTLSEGYLLNNFLPFRLGEVSRAYLMGNKTGLSFWQVLSTILIERALDVFLVASLLLGMLPFVTGMPSARGAALVVGGVVLAALVGLYAIARFPDQFMRLFERLTSRIGFLSRLGKQILPSFLAGLKVLTERGRFLRAMGWFLINLAVAMVQFTIFLLAFVPHGSPLWAIFALAVSSLGIALPSSPGNIGVFEGAIVGALAVFKLDAGTALAYAFTMHFWNYLTTGLLGSYALARDGESIMNLYDRVRNIRKVEAQS